MCRAGRGRRAAPDARVDDLERDLCVPILPLGAIEAHGPHLPLHTDVIIAEAMATAGAERLAESGLHALLLPAVFLGTYAGHRLAARLGDGRVRLLILATLIASGLYAIWSTMVGGA